MSAESGTIFQSNPHRPLHLPKSGRIYLSVKRLDSCCGQDPGKLASKLRGQPPTLAKVNEVLRKNLLSMRSAYVERLHYFQARPPFRQLTRLDYLDVQRTQLPEVSYSQLIRSDSNQRAGALAKARYDEAYMLVVVA